MIRYLLDSDCAIYVMSGQYSLLRERVEKCEPGEVGLSAISLAEIELGAVLDKGPPQERLDAFLRAVPLLDFDATAAKAYAGLPFKRARFDRLIAAHALSIGATVVTNNTGDFADIPALRIENWTQ